MSMLAKQLPKVSREFALDLQRMFPPVRITPNMDSDTIVKLSMQSYGEQRVLEKVLQASSNRVVSSKVEDIKPEPKVENTDNTVSAIQVVQQQEEHSKQVGNWFTRFTTRTAN